MNYKWILSILVLSSIAGIYMVEQGNYQNDQVIKMPENSDGSRVDLPAITQSKNIRSAKIPLSDSIASTTPKILEQTSTIKLNNISLNKLEIILEQGGYQKTDGNGGVVVTDYDSYTLSALRTLSESGDVTAMQLLGGRLIMSRDYVEAKHYLWQASIHGHTKSLIDIASINLLSIATEKNLDKQAQSMLDAYSLIKVAEKRGDILAQSILPIYEQLLTQEQIINTDENIHNLYNQLTDERIEIGLGGWSGALQ